MMMMMMMHSKEIERRLNSRNICCRSVQKLSSSRLLSKILKIKIHRNTTPSVLYGCDTWSLTLREEYRLKVFENRVLRKIFGSQREKETGDWRRLHNEKLHDVYI